MEVRWEAPEGEVPGQQLRLWRQGPGDDAWSIEALVGS
jgi:hypothetical protein